MPTSFLSLDAAIARLCEDEKNNSLLSDRVWPSLHAICEFPQGLSLLRERGLYMEHATAQGSPYHAAWRQGVIASLKVMPLRRTIWNYGPPERQWPIEHPDPLIKIRRIGRHQELVAEIEAACDLVKTVMDHYSHEESLCDALSHWWTTGRAIYSIGTTICADYCRLFYWAWSEGPRGYGIALLDAKSNREGLVESRRAIRGLIDELKNRVSTKPVDKAITTDLMTRDEIAFITDAGLSTLSRMLGKAAVAGGGKSKKSKWHYLAVRPILEEKLGVALPSLEDARAMLAARPTV